uniref:Uncharacterized protein n=1 Tax=Rhizophora mucronata TaxID=61149 RepID=A0A2P2QQ59_RHIMU
MWEQHGRSRGKRNRISWCQSVTHLVSGCGKNETTSHIMHLFFFIFAVES